MTDPHATYQEPAAGESGPRERALEFLRAAQGSPLETLEPLLPLYLNIDGDPFTLNNHFYFAPLYRTHLPDSMVLKTARQQGKSSYAASFPLLLAARHPRFTQLFVTPLFEQIRRFSVNTVGPMIDESPLKSMMLDSTCNQSVLQRTFNNRAMFLFSYAYLSASRIRGISRVWRTSFDEVQDMCMEHVPVILETMSHAPDPWGVVSYTGTPKGLDNPVEKLWSDSSMAEWVVRCPHGGCRHWNFADVEYDLLGMIGPMRDDISPERPGTVCAKCRKVIDPRTGFWKHRHPEKRWDFQGFHVSQPIAPSHYGSPKKWARLIAKMKGLGDYTPNKFYNEVLGCSLDTGAKIVTKSELQAAAVLPWKNDPEVIPAVVKSRKPQYIMRALGVDWGGGGGEIMSGRSESARRQRISFTSMAYLGLRPDGRIDCLWGKRLLTPNDHLLEAGRILEVVRELQPNVIAHDFTGAGALRETFLTMKGYPQERIVGIAYAHAPASKMMVPAGGEDGGDTRPHYRGDKTRMIHTVIAAIKTGMLRFFEYDEKSSDDPGMIRDFLALTEEKVERDGGADLYIIRRLSALPDDFAHAVTFGCCAMWYRHGWPDFASRMKEGPGSLEPGDWRT